MRRKRNFYHTGLDISRSELAWVRNPNITGANDYVVDGNVSTSGDGSIDYPMSTLAEAIAASNASIKLAQNRWWARRNRIFVMGDVLTEDLTQLPTKCDVIGIGSYDGNTKPGLYGHHSSALEAYGTRFYNMHFKAKAHASSVFTLAGANHASGIEFHSCTADATLGTVTNFITSTAMPGLVVDDCDFYGTFAEGYITFGAGEAGKARIINNRMLGTAAKGIIVPNTVTASWMPLIDNNIIRATGMWIDDDASIFCVTNNRGITDIDTSTSTDGYTFNIQLAAGNIQMGATGLCDWVPFAKIAE